MTRLGFSVFIGSVFSFLAQLDHTFEKVPSHGGKQLDFFDLLEVARVQGVTSKKRVFKNLDAKIVLGKVPKSCQTTENQRAEIGKAEIGKGLRIA